MRAFKPSFSSTQDAAEVRQQHVWVEPESKSKRPTATVWLYHIARQGRQKPAELKFNFNPAVTPALALSEHQIGLTYRKQCPPHFIWQ